MNDSIELNVTVDHKRFYNSESMYGVYGVIPNTKKREVETLDYRGIFVISGNMPELQVNNDYDIVIKPSYHKKYGKGYEVATIRAKRPKTAEEQREYIKLMVTENQYNEMVKIYPSEPILDLMAKDEFDYTNMHNIGEDTYIKIKKKLFENLEMQEALVELKDLNISMISMKKLVKHFGSPQIVVQKANSNIYEFCKVDSFGFKKIDEYAMNRGDSPTNPNRIVTATEYVLEQDANYGHSWMRKSKLVSDLVKLLDIDERYIQDTLKKLKNNEDFYFNDNQVALYKNYHYEKKIKEILLEKANSPCKTKDLDNDEAIKKLEDKIGFTYTDEQKEAIQMAINNNVLVINGKGGVGKTTIVKGIVDALNEYSYMACSLSGKATQVLSSYDINSMTIHRMLGVNEHGNFKHHKNNRLSYDIVILDESSMANNYLIYSILVALKDDAKIIMVGDSGQLPSIGTGAIFGDILSDGKGLIPQIELTTVHRQAKKSGILSIANKIRDGNHINDRYDYNTKTFGELKDMTLIPVDKETSIKNMVLDICKRQDKNNINDFQVITGRVDAGDISVKNLNIELQKVFNDISKPFISRGGYEYREGDRVIHNGNNYEAPLLVEDEVFNDSRDSPKTEVFNGTMGRIVKIEFDSDNTRQEHKVHIEFEDIKGIIVYEVSDLSMISLAYAITTHRSQGSTIKNVLFVFDYASYMLLSREFVYTGLTRAGNGCLMIAENDALRHAIEKIAGSRRTFLKEMLKEENLKGQ